MFEKVNPMHPDKLADRIAGALVDKAYEKEENVSFYLSGGSSPKLCVKCSACIKLPSPGRQPAACVPAAGAAKGNPRRAVKGCPA